MFIFNDIRARKENGQTTLYIAPHEDFWVRDRGAKNQSDRKRANRVGYNPGTPEDIPQDLVDELGYTSLLKERVEKFKDLVDSPGDGEVTLADKEIKLRGYGAGIVLVKDGGPEKFSILSPHRDKNAPGDKLVWASLSGATEELEESADWLDLILKEGLEEVLLTIDRKLVVYTINGFPNAPRTQKEEVRKLVISQAKGVGIPFDDFIDVALDITPPKDAIKIVENEGSYPNVFYARPVIETKFSGLELVTYGIIKNIPPGHLRVWDGERKDTEEFLNREVHELFPSGRVVIHQNGRILRTTTIDMLLREREEKVAELWRNENKRIPPYSATAALATLTKPATLPYELDTLSPFLRIQFGEHHDNKSKNGLIQIKRDRRHGGILMLSYGGTCISGWEEGGLSPKYTLRQIFDTYPELKGIEDNVNVVLKDLPQPIDSTEAKRETIVKITSDIEEEYQNYEGFVITYGTDTMQRLAHGLAFTLRNLQKPVIITGAQIAPVKPGSDVRKNFYDALLFANEGLSGVYVVFNRKAYLGTRVIKDDTGAYEAFKSINYEPVAGIEHDVVNITHTPYVKQNGEFSAVAEISEKVKKIDTNELNDAIGFENELEHKITEGARGLVIIGRGAGNIPTDFSPAIQRGIDKGIYFVITIGTQSGTTSTEYKVSGAKLKVLPAYDMVASTAEIKLRHVLGVLGESADWEDIDKMMRTNFADEYLGPGMIKEL